MKKIITTLLAVCCMFVFYSCNNSGGKSSFSNEETKEEVKELTQEEKYATVESTREYLENTTWTYTEPGDMWIRLVFKNGKVYYYSAYPSKGDWGEGSEYCYRITEERYADTGKRYVSVEIVKDMNDENCYIALAPESGVFLWWGAQVLMEPKDYQWD